MRRRVAIPRRLVLRGRRWTVRLVKRVPRSNDGQRGRLLGMNDPKRRVIWISSQIARYRQEEVLAHEVLHVLFPVGVVDTPTEERIVFAIAPRLTEAIASGALSATTEGVG